MSRRDLNNFTKQDIQELRAALEEGKKNHVGTVLCCQVENIFIEKEAEFREAIKTAIIDKDTRVLARSIKSGKDWGIETKVLKNAKSELERLRREKSRSQGELHAEFLDLTE